jgi:dTDP-4-dehydrorhamnose reductase
LKILITGASGLLGSKVAEVTVKREFKVFSSIFFILLFLLLRRINFQIDIVDEQVLNFYKLFVEKSNSP